MDGPTYLRHITGLASLAEWLQLVGKTGYSFTYTASGVVLPPLLAQRFLIGTPRNKKFGKNPFFGCQRTEAVFFNMLNIQRIAIRAGEAALHFVCPLQEGDGKEYADLPAFYLTIQMDQIEKTDTLARAPLLDCYRFWIDEDTGTPQLTAKDKLWTLPIVHLAAEGDLFSEQDSQTQARKAIKGAFKK